MTPALKGMRPELIILSVMLALVTLALLGLIIYILVVRSKACAQDTLQDQHMVTPEQPTGSSLHTVKDVLTGNYLSDASQWTYSATLCIARFEQESYPIILLGRGDAGKPMQDMQFMVLLSPQNNDLFVCFKRVVSSTDRGSVFDADIGHIPSLHPVAQSFCMFKVDNIPFFRYFTLDVVFDYNSSFAKVYVDGVLTQTMNVADCANALSKHDTNTMVLGY